MIARHKFAIEGELVTHSFLIDDRPVTTTRYEFVDARAASQFAEEAAVRWQSNTEAMVARMREHLAGLSDA